MKAKPDPRIDTYIANSAEFARPILRHLRKLVHAACPEIEETLKWSAPTFMLGNKILCGMAAFKEHCAFRFWHAHMASVIPRDGDQHAARAMGHFGRITRLADLPDDKTLSHYIVEAAKLTASGKTGRPRPSGGTKSKPELPVPDDLRALLKRNKKAGAIFEGFSPSHRREYLEWIADAKREETREKRLLATVEWLTEGKKRNWKYENC